MNIKYLAMLSWFPAGMIAGCLATAILMPGGNAAFAGPDPSGPDPSGQVMGLAASSSAPLKYALDEKLGTIAWLSGSFPAPAPGNPVESAYKFLENHRAAFQVQAPRQEFAVMLTRKDKLLATEHVYLERKINGRLVWGHRLGFHFDARGTLYAINGKYAPTPAAGRLAVSPLITAAQAKDIVLQNLRNSPGKWPAATAAFSVADRNIPVTLNSQVPQTAQLIYYPDSQGNLRLSYLVTFFVDAPPGDWVYFVDAISGAILFRMNNIQTSGPAIGSGLDLFDNTVSLNTYLDTDGRYKLVNTTKRMSTQHSTHSNTTWQGSVEVRDAQHATSGGSPVSEGNNPVVYDPDGDNVFTSGGSDPKNNYQPAVQLARFASDTYDFFYNMWGRNSLDDQGIAMIGNIHWGSKYDNSMWTPTLKMTFFGDGSDNYWPESRSLDTVTHEFMHGVTTFAVPPNGYTYITESGAINESLSDIAAVSHDYDNWNYGEDYHKDGSASRRFDDPSAVATAQPADMYDFYLMPLQIDNGGVHYNSGIGNHFFYQFAERLPAEAPASDGRFKASKAVYRSYVYGAANSYATFREWGQYIKQACIDLYGPGATFDKLVEALNYVHIPQARISGNDNWQLLLDNTGQPYFFSLAAVGVYGWPCVSVRFTRPSSDVKLKTVGICFQDIGACSYRLWYSGVSANGSPDEAALQLLFSGISSSSVRTDYRFTNFKLTNSISVASDFHVILELVSGYYGALTYDTGEAPTERSWFRYTTYTGAYTWYKTKEYFALYPTTYPAGFDPNLMIKIIYETTPQDAPVAPTLASPANGETINSQDVTFSWNSVSGADRYFLEANSSSAWDENARVYFAVVYGTSQTVSGFPVGANYWRVWAGNADAWSTASETRAFTETVPPPALACSVASLSATSAPNQGAFSQSFTIYNSGSGTLTYSLNDDAGWLSVSPTNGTSTGESDTIQVTYNTSGLYTGVYSASITISASGAAGAPATIPVTFTLRDVTPVAADFDGDGRADPAVVMAGNWYFWPSVYGYQRLGPYSFSEVGATPAAGDFDGDRRADPAGMDTSGNWYIRYSAAGYLRGGPYGIGDSSYLPVCADFDGDGYADSGGMNSAGNWLIWMSRYAYLRGGPYAFGGAGWLPRAADFDGDAQADPAAVDSDGNWYIWFSASGYLRGGPYPVGLSGLAAVAADFDGDRRADPAGMSASGGWYFWLSSAGYARLGPVNFSLP